MSARLLAFRALLLLAIVFALAMALLPHPPQLIETNDKWRHMLAFATLSLLAAGGYPRTSLWRIGERLSFLGALIEVFQSIPALHRDCDVMDWLADNAAIAVALLLVAAVRRVRAAT